MYEAKDWVSGVFIGASLSSESTAAAQDANGGNDPFAMRPFCGYHMADYWAHWLSMGRDSGVALQPVGVPKVLPKIFGVNWFRTATPGGKPTWPGFSDNSRVIDWAFRRCDEAEAGVMGIGNCAVDSAIGYLPKSLDLSGLKISTDDLNKIMAVDPEEWKLECADIERYFKFVGYERVPLPLRQKLDELKTKFSELTH